MKKLFMLTIFTIILNSCTSPTSKIEKAILSKSNNIEKIENIIISEQYEDSFRSPSDKGTTYKFSATVYYKNGNKKEYKNTKIFIADKDGWSNW